MVRKLDFSVSPPACGVEMLTITEPSGVEPVLIRGVGVGVGYGNKIRAKFNLKQQKLTDGSGRLSNDGSVEGSEPSEINSSSSSSSSSPMIERESNIEDRRDDCDMYDDADDVESVLPRELEVSELNIKLVGVNTSVWEDTEGGNAGTGVNGCSGDRGGAEAIGEIEAGIVLIRPTEDADPLGLNIDVSKEVSRPS